VNAWSRPGYCLPWSRSWVTDYLACTYAYGGKWYSIRDNFKVSKQYHTTHSRTTSDNTNARLQTLTLTCFRVLCPYVKFYGQRIIPFSKPVQSHIPWFCKVFSCSASLAQFMHI
jgi:hypothetical protein